MYSDSESVDSNNTGYIILFVY